MGTKRDQILYARVSTDVKTMIKKAQKILESSELGFEDVSEAYTTEYLIRMGAGTLFKSKQKVQSRKNAGNEK